MLPNCPLCHDGNSVRQAHRRKLDGVWRFFGWFAYRCDSCTTRFYRFLKPKPHQSASR
jgi:hypothetical protein